MLAWANTCRTGKPKPCQGGRGDKLAEFTLLEQLVVVGIIVTLAAITVPLVTKFGGKGDEGALKAETQTVQSAMNAFRPMRAPRCLASCTRHSQNPSRNGHLRRHGSGLGLRPCRDERTEIGTDLLAGQL